MSLYEKTNRRKPLHADVTGVTAPSARQPDMARHNSKDKGKARAAAGYYQGIINQRPSYQQQYSQADSGSSTISRRSDSNATHSTGTDPTTLGSSAGKYPRFQPCLCRLSYLKSVRTAYADYITCSGEKTFVRALIAAKPRPDPNSWRTTDRTESDWLRPRGTSR